MTGTDLRWGATRIAEELLIRNGLVVNRARRRFWRRARSLGRDHRLTIQALRLIARLEGRVR